MHQGRYRQAIIVNPGIWRSDERNEHQQAAIFHPIPRVPAAPKKSQRPNAGQSDWQVGEPYLLRTEPKTKRDTQAWNVRILNSLRPHHYRIIDPHGRLGDGYNRATGGDGNRCAGQYLVAF